MERTLTRNSDEIDLGDLALRLTSRWRLIALVTIIGAAVAFGISKLMPKVYESRAVVYVQKSQFPTTLMSNLPLGLGAGANKDNNYFITLLKSENLMRRVIAGLDLTRNPDFAGEKRLTNAKALEKLQEKVFVVENQQDGIELTSRASTPALAACIVNSMLDNLGELVVTSSKRKADFISKKLEETNNNLRKAEEELLGFQETHDVTAIDDETEALIGDLSRLDGQLVEINVELQQVESELANAGRLESLVDLEVRKKSLESSATYLTREIEELQKRFENLPAVAMQYARLQRNVGVLSKTFELLTEQYQLANISQHGEDGDYQIVDMAVPKDKPVAPRAMLNAGIGGVLGFFLSACIASRRHAYAKKGKARPKET